MTYKEIVRRVSEDINLPEEIVDKVYKLYWTYIKDTIQSLPLKDNLSEEEFNSLLTNFNIPSLGKLNCPYDRYKNIKNRYKHTKIKN